MTGGPDRRGSLIRRQIAVKDPQPVRDDPGNAIVFAAAVASPIGIPGIGVPAALGALSGRKHPIELRLIATESRRVRIETSWRCEFLVDQAIRSQGQSWSVALASSTSHRRPVDAP